MKVILIGNPPNITNVPYNVPVKNSGYLRDVVIVERRNGEHVIGILSRTFLLFGLRTKLPQKNTRLHHHTGDKAPSTSRIRRKAARL